MERAAGRVQVIDLTTRTNLASIPELGDLSHASAVFSRDARYAYVFGRDGGLSKVDLLAGRLERRIVQAGNSIGGAISQNGKLIAVSNYEPGGVRVFDAVTLEPVADIPTGSKTVGLVDAPDQRFVFSLYDLGEIWMLDMSDPGAPEITKYPNVGKYPYDALITPDGRYYVAGLSGEDGLALLDLWHPEQVYGAFSTATAMARSRFPSIRCRTLKAWRSPVGTPSCRRLGGTKLLVVDMEQDWREVGRIPVHGQPVFAVSRPDGRQIWVNFAHPDNDTVQVIDASAMKVVHSIRPGPAVLHLEFTPRGEQVWISVRDADRVDVYDTRSFERLGSLPADKPSGIFMTARANRIGY